MKINENIQIGDNEVTLKDLLKSREFMIIALNQDQKVTTDGNTKVNFNVLKDSNSDNLTFSNNGIKIGAGISKIRIDLTLWLECDYGAYSAWYIYKNNSGYTYNIAPAPTNGDEYWRTANSFLYLDVKEGDVIYAYVRFSKSGSMNKIAGWYTNSCLLSVQVIE